MAYALGVVMFYGILVAAAVSDARARRRDKRRRRRRVLYWRATREQSLY